MLCEWVEHEAGLETRGRQHAAGGEGGNRCLYLRSGPNFKWGCKELELAQIRAPVHGWKVVISPVRGVITIRDPKTHF